MKIQTAIITGMWKQMRCSGTPLSSYLLPLIHRVWMTAQQLAFPVMMVIKKNSVAKKKEKMMMYLKVITFFTRSHQKGGCLPSIVIIIVQQKKTEGAPNQKGAGKREG